MIALQSPNMWVTDISRQQFLAWIAKYETAWRTAGIELLPDLFAVDATYRAAPFDDPKRGLEEIAVFWEAEREGPDEVFALHASIIAADVATAVARIEVGYGDPVSRTYRDLWVITLDDCRLCTAFEEWPFFPGRQRVASQ